MDFTFLLDERNMTIYECSKKSSIPYSTLSDIIHGKTKMENASFRYAYYLSKTLGITMEELYDQMHVPERTSFEHFKSFTCHRVKEEGDKGFIADMLSGDEIRNYYRWKWFPESFYLLAMLDYLSRENNIPLCNDFDDLRGLKLATPIYPVSVDAASLVMNNDELRTEALSNALPEFLRHNIVESEVRNVI